MKGYEILYNAMNSFQRATCNRSTEYCSFRVSAICAHVIISLYRFDDQATGVLI